MHEALYTKESVAEPCYTTPWGISDMMGRLGIIPLSFGFLVFYFAVFSIAWYKCEYMALFPFLISN